MSSYPHDPIQAITFDVGGTLIEPWPSVGHIYADVAAKHGSNGLSVASLNHQFANAWRARQHFDYSRAGWAEIVDASFAGLVAVPPSHTFFEELCERFAQPNAWRVFEDVFPSLRSISERGLRLGIISNWDERLRPLLRHLRLESFFEVIVVSCEVGVCKPARAVFQRAVDALGLPPHAILHVGDSLKEDVAGARDAGLQSLLLKRGTGEDQLPENQIRSLAELCEQLLHPHSGIIAPPIE
jgi:putative hydrolase of the HAD superfamily